MPKKFREMILNLGLSHCDDEQYEPDYVAEVLDRFLTRNYSPNGRGSFFYIPGAKGMPQIDLWRQMLGWLKTKER